MSVLSTIKSRKLHHFLVREWYLKSFITSFFCAKKFPVSPLLRISSEIKKSCFKWFETQLSCKNLKKSKSKPKAKSKKRTRWSFQSFIQGPQIIIEFWFKSQFARNGQQYFGRSKNLLLRLLWVWKSLYCSPVAKGHSPLAFFPLSWPCPPPPEKFSILNQIPISN